MLSFCFAFLFFFFCHDMNVCLCSCLIIFVACSGGKKSRKEQQGSLSYWGYEMLCTYIQREKLRLSFWASLKASKDNENPTRQANYGSEA